jgi:peptidoglycan/LPS O-acetylase OafA/YrhL
LIGSHYSTATAYFAFFVGLGASTFGAWVMYRVIERPAVSLARKIRLPQRRDSTAPVVIATGAAASVTPPG